MLRSSRSSKLSQSTDGGARLDMSTPVFFASSTTIDNPDLDLTSPKAMTVDSMDSSTTTSTTDSEQSPSVVSSSASKPQLRRVMRQESLRSAASSTSGLHAQQQQQPLPASNTSNHASPDKNACVEDYDSSRDDLSLRSPMVNHSGSEQAMPESPAAMLESPAAIVESPAAMLQSPVAMLQSPAAMLQSPAAMSESPSAMSENPATIEARMWASIGAQDDDSQDDARPRTYGRVVEEIAAEEAREAHHCLDILSVAIDSLDFIDNAFARGQDSAIRARTMILHIREELDRITQNSASRQILQYQDDVLSQRLNHRARWERRADHQFWDTYGTRTTYRM